MFCRLTLQSRRFKRSISNFWGPGITKMPWQGLFSLCKKFVEKTCGNFFLEGLSKNRLRNWLSHVLKCFYFILFLFWNPGHALIPKCIFTWDPMEFLAYMLTSIVHWPTNCIRNAYSIIILLCASEKWEILRKIETCFKTRCLFSHLFVVYSLIK